MPSASSRSAGASGDVVRRRSGSRPHHVQRQAPQFGDRQPVARELHARPASAGDGPGGGPVFQSTTVTRRPDRAKTASIRPRTASPANVVANGSSTSCGIRAAHARGRGRRPAARSSSASARRRRRPRRAARRGRAARRRRSSAPASDGTRCRAVDPGSARPGTGRRSRRASAAGPRPARPAWTPTACPAASTSRSRSHGGGVPRAAPRRRAGPAGSAASSRAGSPPACTGIGRRPASLPVQLGDRADSFASTRSPRPARPRAAHRAGRPARWRCVARGERVGGVRRRRRGAHASGSVPARARRRRSR